METKATSKTKILKNNVWLLKRVLKYSPSYLIIVVSFGALRGLFAAVSTLYLKYLLEFLNIGKTFKEILILILTFALLFIINSLTSNWFYHFFVPIKHETILKELQTDLFKKAHTLDLQKYDDPNFFNDFIWAMDQSYEQTTGLIDQLGVFVTSLIATFSITGILINIDLFLGVAIISFAALRLYEISKLNKVWLETSFETNTLQRKENYIKRIFMLPDYASILRICNIKENLFHELKNVLINKNKLNDKYINKKAFRIIMANLFAVVSDLGLLIYVLYNVMVTKTITIGGLAVAVGSIWSISSFLKEMVDKLMAFQKTGMFSEKIINFMNTSPQILSGKIKADKFKSLEIKNLTFKYTENGNVVLKNINLKIEKGQKIAIVGYNGAGKTTLTKLIMRLYDTNEGEILYNNINLKEYTLESLRNKISAVFQDYQIFAASIKENVIGGECVDDSLDEKILQVLSSSTFKDKLNSLDNGINTVLTREFDNSGTQLSGGERQKISIARAFYKNSDLIILDEPSSALDPDAEYELNQAISDYAKEKAVIFISHRLSTTRSADKIYMFENGEIIESGTHEELMALNKKYAYMFNLQAENYLK